MNGTGLSILIVVDCRLFPGSFKYYKTKLKCTENSKISKMRKNIY